MGNISLLFRAVKAQVKISRSFSKEYKKDLQDYWSLIAKEGHVLISPFIHPEEKDALNNGIPLGGCIIYFGDNGFRERAKPTGRFFDLCASGRLLLIGQPTYDHSHELSYSFCQYLNNLAKTLAETPASEIRLRPIAHNRK